VILYLAVIGAAFLTWFLVHTLFAPDVPYHIEREIDVASDHFVQVLEASCQTTLHEGNTIEILTDGVAFYPAMLEAIEGARETINLECYILRKGEIAGRLVDALVERGRAGVRVTVVVDAIGGLGSFGRFARILRAAGCRVEAYQPPTWYRLGRLNNRTHRELLIIDGRVAFVGGAGVADWWIKPSRGGGPWRDMMARVAGPLVSDIQGAFAENWLECHGEILTGPDTYKPQEQVGTCTALAVKSSPADRATSSRILFQMLVEGSNRRVLMATPYFLPDSAFRRAIVRTARRGVAITVIVPGPLTDQRWVRLASRRLYGELLGAGIRIFEYQGAMMHLKGMVIDDLWSVFGSTNLDNRSFEHNDEVNIAVRDEATAARLTLDLEADISRSDEVTLVRWRRRSIGEKLVGAVAWILERQQ
jgi:cardiolipin synthase